jgi:hypothetical protein
MTAANSTSALRLDDLPDDAPGRPLGLERLAGTWLNTDGGSSGGVSRFVIEDSDGRLRVTAFGVGDPDPYRWPEVEAVAFAPTAGESQAWAFNCRFEWEGMATDVSAYNKQGILVAAIFTTFTDGSGRSDYWTREFFHREEGA